MAIHKGSLNSKLLELEIGDTLLIECLTKVQGTQVQRQVSSRSRWPKEMADRAFKTSNLLGVSSDFETYHIVRVERIERIDHE